MESNPPSRPNESAPKPSDLHETIDKVVIPNLILAHYSLLDRGEGCGDSRMPPTTEEIAVLVDLAVAQDLPRAFDYLHRLMSEGMSFETLLVHLLAPAARQLGQDWLDDKRSFTEVSIGSAVIQQLIGMFGPRSVVTPDALGLVLLVIPVNEQHTLGVYALAELLRRAHYDVVVVQGADQREIATLVRKTWVTAVGISVQRSEAVPLVHNLVRTVRAKSKNPNVGLLVGGCSVDELTELADDVTVCREANDAITWLAGRATLPPS